MNHAPKTSTELLGLAKKHLYPNYRPASIVLARGKGCELFDVEGKRWLTLEATGYGPGENGRWGDRTKVGTKVGLGTVAVDPRVIPLGSRLWVEGYGFCVALDVGSAIKGRPTKRDRRLIHRFNDAG